MKIGLLQTERFGDLIITLPIAQWFMRRGHQVVWPVSGRFIAPLQAAAPGIDFRPVDPALKDSDPTAYFYHRPRAEVLATGCEVIFPLYVHVLNAEGANENLIRTLKFDEYKYALTGVPFTEKWNLHLVRDRGRELVLHKMLNITRPYICVHTDGSNIALNMALPPAWREQYQIIEMRPLTDNPLDWLYTLENASKRVLLDSCFANLAEQLGMTAGAMGDNYLIVRSVAQATPVYANGWKFRWPLDPIVA